MGSWGVPFFAISAGDSIRSSLLASRFGAHQVADLAIVFVDDAAIMSV